jgi:hypothetical protein
MRVVRDDAAGLVGWLAPGTPVLRPTLTDGRELRSTPMAERFDSGRHAAAAEDVVGRWGSPFCDRWEDWRPDPGWPTPQLPTELVAAATFR